MGTVEKILLDDEFSPRYWFTTGVPVNDAPVATPTRLEGGWLRLVDHQAKQHAFAQSGKSFSSNKFDIKFSLIWQKDAAGTGESGGGFCLALADADELAGVGSYGRNGDNLGYRGLKGSFIGIGFSVGANSGFLYDFRLPLLTPLIGYRLGEKKNFQQAGFFELYDDFNMQGERVALNLPISREHPLGLEFPFEINVFPCRRFYETTGFHEFQITLNGHLLFSQEIADILPKKMKLVLTATTGSSNRDAFLVGPVKVTEMSESAEPVEPPVPVVSRSQEAFAGFMIGVPAKANFLTDGDWVKAGWDGKAPWTGDKTKGLPISFGVTLASQPLVSEIIVVSRQDVPGPQPADTLKFTKYGATSLRVEYVDAQGQTQTVSSRGGDANDLVVRRYPISPPVPMRSVNAVVLASADGNTTPLTQIELRGVKS